MAPDSLHRPNTISFSCPQAKVYPQSTSQEIFHRITFRCSLHVLDKLRIQIGTLNIGRFTSKKCTQAADMAILTDATKWLWPECRLSCSRSKIKDDKGCSADARMDTSPHSIYQGLRTEAVLSRPPVCPPTFAWLILLYLTWATAAYSTYLLNAVEVADVSSEPNNIRYTLRDTFDALDLLFVSSDRSSYSYSVYYRSAATFWDFKRFYQYT